MKGPVARLAEVSAQNPGRVFAWVAIAVLVSLLRLPSVQLHTSNLDLIDPDLPEVKHFLEFTSAFGTPNALVVVFEGNDGQAMRQAVDKIAPGLRALPEVRVVLERPPYDSQLLVDNGLEPYLCNDEETMFFIFVQPRDDRSSTAALAPFVASVQKVLDEAKLPATVQAGLTGIPKYALDDQATIQGDITKLSLVSLILIIFIFALGFPSFWGPLAATLTLLASIALCVGFVSIVPGHLTLLSAMFVSMIFGLGIDYGIHLVHHVEALMLTGLQRKVAVIQAFEELERPLNAAVATTTGVFFTLMVSGFRGFEELGLIAGVGLLISYLMIATLLPALLVKLPGQAKLNQEHHWLGRLLIKMQSRWTGPVLILVTGALPMLGWPAFDSNYLNLQPLGSEAVKLEQRMVANSDFSPYFAAFVCDTREQAKDLADRLRLETTVADARSLTDLDELSETPLVPPAELSSVFLDAKGRFAVYAYPSVDIWDAAQNRIFLDRMRAIDPQSTGMPFLGDFMIERSKRALELTAMLSFGVLLISAWVCFRNIKQTLLATMVPLVTMIWMGGILKLTGSAFNPLNVMAIPIVLGIAIDDGVHLIHRYQESKGDMKQTLLQAGHGVVLTSLTTLAAFGAVMFSAHRGLSGFSFALFTGVAVALFLSVTLLPWALERTMGRKNP